MAFVFSAGEDAADTETHTPSPALLEAAVAKLSSKDGDVALEGAMEINEFATQQNTEALCEAGVVEALAMMVLSPAQPEERDMSERQTDSALGALGCLLRFGGADTLGRLADAGLLGVLECGAAVVVKAGAGALSLPGLGCTASSLQVLKELTEVEALATRVARCDGLTTGLAGLIDRLADFTESGTHPGDHSGVVADCVQSARVICQNIVRLQVVDGVVSSQFPATSVGGDPCQCAGCLLINLPKPPQYWEHGSLLLRGGILPALQRLATALSSTPDGVNGAFSVLIGDLEKLELFRAAGLYPRMAALTGRQVSSEAPDHDANCKLWFGDVGGAGETWTIKNFNMEVGMTSTFGQMGGLEQILQGVGMVGPSTAPASAAPAAPPTGQVWRMNPANFPPTAEETAKIEAAARAATEAALAAGRSLPEAAAAGRAAAAAATPSDADAMVDRMNAMSAVALQGPDGQTLEGDAAMAAIAAMMTAGPDPIGVTPTFDEPTPPLPPALARAAAGGLPSSEAMAAADSRVAPPPSAPPAATPTAPEACGLCTPAVPGGPPQAQAFSMIPGNLPPTSEETAAVQAAERAASEAALAAGASESEAAEAGRAAAEAATPSDGDAWIARLQAMTDTALAGPNGQRLEGDAAMAAINAMMTAGPSPIAATGGTAPATAAPAAPPKPFKRSCSVCAAPCSRRRCGCGEYVTVCSDACWEKAYNLGVDGAEPHRKACQRLRREKKAAEAAGTDQ